MSTQHDDLTAAGVAGTWHLVTGSITVDHAVSSVVVGVAVWVITQILKGIWKLIRGFFPGQRPPL